MNHCVTGVESASVPYVNLNRPKLQINTVAFGSTQFSGRIRIGAEISKSIEVKSDEKSKYTGNIVVEIEFNGKPSALSTTEADYWVWWDGHSLTWFTVDLIKRCIKETNPPLCKFVGKGDSKQKKAYLIKKEVLYRYSLSNNNKV